MLDLKLIFSTFLVVFLAELGDKTQIATFAFACESKSEISVFIGAASALVLTTFIAVLIGGTVGKVIPIKATKLTAGIIFLVFGIWTIAEAIKG